MDRQTKEKECLEIYEEKCPHCHGTGKRLWANDLIDLYSRWCKYCKGKGKLDWIDKLKRRKNKK